MITNKMIDMYSVEYFKKLLESACKKYSCATLAKSSNVARSTICRILDGKIADVKLTKAQQILSGIKKLEKNKKKA